MGYAIEMSHRINNTNMVANCNNFDEYIRKLAHNSDSYYTMNEYNENSSQKYKKKIELISVYVVIFSENNFDDFLTFIKEIKKEKNIYIECIYQDDVTCDIIYASSKYLKKNDKDFVKLYKQNKNKNISNLKKDIYNALCLSI
tara:strand:+ start:1342 stop:1770 length:429 start_codon:yes stop_codon:yes gene_type:complete